METIELKCPSCGAPVHGEAGREQCFCQYCGSRIVIPVSAASAQKTAAQEVRMRELALEEQRFRAQERHRDQMNAELAAWRRTRNIWLMLMAVTITVDLLYGSDVTSTLFSLCFIFGGCFVYFSKPRP